jgi:hypothetical protein
MASALFAMIAAYSPELPGAVCVDPAAREIFDRVDTRATAAVAEAAWVCSRCPALTACRAWVEGLPPARRPRGVVGGLVIASRTGRDTINYGDRSPPASGPVFLLVRRPVALAWRSAIPDAARYLAISWQS